MTLTIHDVAEALPPHLKGSASQGLVDALNQIPVDPEVAEAIRDNFISYTRVLTEGRFKIDDYLNAVAYVSFKLMGYSNKEAYERTFPQRYQALIARGASSKDISAYVAAYHSNKLVTLVLEQSVIPSWVLNQDVYQKAINTQFELMNDTQVSPKVRTEAANSILTHLKRPESKQVELNVRTGQSSGLDELKGMMTQLAQQQIALLESGAVQTREVAHQKLITSEEVFDLQAKLVE